MTDLEKAKLIFSHNGNSIVDRLCRLVEAGILNGSDAQRILFARQKPVERVVWSNPDDPGF